MNKVNKTHERPKNIEEIIDQHDEIKEALEIMHRILTVEDVKARNIVEQPERYFQIR